MKKMVEQKKITICGAGRVGSTAALFCLLKELGDIVLWNRTGKVAQGIALDMMETKPLIDSDVSVIGTSDFKQTKGSDVVVITAGAQRKAGMNRDDLIDVNKKIVGDITQKVVRYNKHAVLIIVSNPLDAMVYHAKKVSGFPKQRIMGMAGILDSSRFKSFIAKELKVSVEDVHAMVMGSHGDAMIPLAQHASVRGIPLAQLMKRGKISQLVKKTRGAGAEVIKLQKSSAYYSPGASIAEMVESIVKDKKRVLPCAAYLSGEYGVRGIFMGVPVRLGSKGVERVLELTLTKQEKKQFARSAKKVKGLVAVL
jgi:malate dehydrogenase